MSKKIAIIGAGAFGTSLYNVFHRHEKNVSIYNRDNLEEASNAETILFVTSSQSIRDVCKRLEKQQMSGKSVVLCSKGFEMDTGTFLSDIILEYFPDVVVSVLSGPSFADDLNDNKPTAVTLAAGNIDQARSIRDTLKTKILRIYPSGDLKGVQIAGALKNVLAIASGIVMGKNLGESARAALITRGIAEINRFICAYGGHEETMTGMGGIGDIILTCTSLESRNCSFGYALGQGHSAAQILNERASVTEGVHTAKALKLMMDDKNLDMPICDTVYKIIHEGMSVDQAIEGLLSRPV